MLAAVDEYQDDFDIGEGTTLPTGWTSTGTDPVVITGLQATVNWPGNDPDTGTDIMYVPQDSDAANTNHVPSTAGLTNVWVDMWVSPNLYDGVATNRSAADVGSSSAAFFFDTNGHVVVNSGATTNWTIISTDLSGDAIAVVGNDTSTNMQRVTVYLDYANKTYDLFLNGTLLREDLGFKTTANGSLTQVQVSDDAYLDMVTVSATGYPGESDWVSGTGFEIDSDEDYDGAGDAWEIHYFGSVAGHDGGTDTDGDGRTDSEEYQDGTDPTDGASASWVIPYFEKFASGGVGDDLDTTFRAFTELAGTAKISDTHLTAMSDTRGIDLSAGGISVVVSNDNATNIFCQVYVKPVACPEVPSNAVTTEAAAICVVTNTLYVFNDTGWEATDISGSQLTNGTWIGLAAHLVYAGVNGQGSWDLYYSADNEFASTMTKVNDTPLLFNTGYVGDGKFSSLVITNESSVTTHVDAVAVSLSYSPTHTDYTNLVIFERVADADSVAVMPPYDYANAKISDNGETDLGRDLTIGLFPGDSIWVSNQFEYVLQNTGVFNRETGGSDPIINDTTGLVISRNPGSDTLAFYPYSNITWTASPVVISNLTASTPGRMDINVPLAAYAGVCFDINEKESLGFDGKAHAWDELLFFNPNTRRSRKFYYDDSVDGGSWMRKGKKEAYEVCPGDAFMYYNKGAGTVTWQLPAL